MDLILGAAVGTLLAKVGEKTGEKLLDKGLDKSIAVLSPKAANLYKRMFGDTQFSDVFSTDERRAGAEATLGGLRERLDAIVRIAGAAFPETSRAERGFSPEAALAALDQMLEQQQNFGRALEQATADYPSLVPLIGYLLVQALPPGELQQLIDIRDSKLNEHFVFITMVPSYYRGRMGFMHTSRSSLLHELTAAKESIDRAQVPEETVLAVRAVEKLSLGLRAAMFAAQTLLAGKPKVDQLPKAIRVVGRFMRAEHAFHLVLAAEEPPPDELAAELARLSGQGWHAMGYKAHGVRLGIHESLEYVDNVADEMLKAIRRLGTVRPAPH